MTAPSGFLEKTQLAASASTAPAVLNSKTRIPELDGLRGIALLLVICWHYGSCMMGWTHENFFFSWMRYAWCGVDLFFVLSGFLLGGILMDARESPSYFKTFYIRRAFRILPIYYIMLTIMVVASIDIAAGRMNRFIWLFANPRGVELTSYMVFLQNISMSLKNDFGPIWLAVTWSLAVEEQFYLTLPLLIRFIPRKLLPFLLIVCIASVPFVRYYFSMKLGNLAAYFLMICRSDALLLGVLSAWACRVPAIWKFLKQRYYLLYIPFILSYAVIFYMKAYMKVAGVVSNEMAWYGFSVFAVLFTSLLLLSITHTTGIIARFLRLNWLCKIGTVSYAIYLFHYPVLGIIHALLFKAPPTGHSEVSILYSAGYLSLNLLCFAMTCGLAALSWTFLEKPLINFGRKYTY